MTQEEFWDRISFHMDCDDCPIPEHETLPRCELGYSCGGTLWLFYSQIARLERENSIKELRGELDEQAR